MALTMIDELAEVAQRQPDAPFSFYEGRVTTFGALWERARRVAGALRAMGLARGERVLYLGKNTDRLLEVIYGAAIARTTCVVMNWRLAPPEWLDIVRDSGATTLFADFEFVDAARALADQSGGQLRQLVAIDLPVLPDDPRLQDHDALVQASEPLSPMGCEPEDDFLQLYTSGTTGRPKGVPQTHAMHLSQRAQWESRIGRFAPDERFLVFMPLFHAAGITYPLFSIGYGTQVEIHRAADPARIVEALSSGRITAAVAVPTLLTMLAPGLQPGMFPSLRCLHYGASAINHTLLERMMAVLGCDFVQIYAATETTAALCMLSPDDHRRGLERPELWASAGKPGHGVLLRVVDADGCEQAPGGAGEILVSSASVLRGYWRNPDATRDALRDGWYHTGDIGRIDADGYVYVLDRSKDMIISGGENVYSCEVENHLAGMPGLAESAVVGVPDAQWGEAVTACVVPQAGEPVPSLEAIQAFLRPRLAGYKLPRQLAVMEALPRNPMGKLQKHRLRELVRERLARRTVVAE